MGLDFIQNHFDLPALMRTLDEFEGRGTVRIEPGGGQTVDLLRFAQARIGDALFDHAHQQRLDAFLLLLLAGNVGCQITAITELAQVGGQMMARQRPQHMRPASAHRLPEAQAGKLRIMQEQQVGFKGRQQFFGQPPLGLGVVADRGIDDGVRATFTQRQQPNLGERPLAVLIAGPGKGGGIGLCIRHILHRAVQGHQAFAETVGSDGLWRTQRATTAGKEALQGRDAQLLAAVPDG
jgi:hypothetical protein